MGVSGGVGGRGTVRGPCTAGNTTPLCSRTTTQPSARQRVTCLPRVHATADQGLAALAGGAAAAARMPNDERAGRVSHAVGQRQSTWTRCVRGTATRRGGALTRLGPSPSWVPAAQVARGACSNVHVHMRAISRWRKHSTLAATACPATCSNPSPNKRQARAGSAAAAHVMWYGAQYEWSGGALWPGLALHSRGRSSPCRTCTPRSSTPR